jgi:hypothetical protein
MKIAEALLYRKQCEAKVKQLEPLRLNGEQGVYTTKVQRVNVSDNVDEATLTIPRITLEDITAEFDFWASELRKVDGAIQQANWTHDVGFEMGKKVTKK